MAVDRYKKKDSPQECDFVNCVAWNKTAELVANYMSKGSQIGVSGRIQVRNYDAKDGTKRYVTEVIVDEVQFLDSKGQKNTPVDKPKSTFKEDMVEVLDSGDIPFN